MERNENSGISCTSRRKRRRLSSDSTTMQCSMNSAFTGDQFLTEIGQKIRKHESFSHGNGAVLHGDPFVCCLLPNFISEQPFIQKLEQELEDVVFHEKNNDLYRFQQSDDLANMKSSCIKMLRHFFLTDIRQWMIKATGIPLTEKVDMTCSKYEYTDVLLCHDDELAGRRVAFILYLVPQWSQEDGGALDLFSSDEHGQPKTVAKSLTPAWNSFAFFEVSPVSFHQVAEVFSKTKTRLSVNGWFYGPDIERPVPYLETEREQMLPKENDIEVEEWINPVYLNTDTQTEIQEKFEADSEIQLRDFLVEEKYIEVANAIKSSSINWKTLGPPNKRNYSTVEISSTSEILRQCVKILQSKAVFQILSNMSGLDLVLANKSDDETRNISSDMLADKGEDTLFGTCSCELRQWTHGAYTLVHDHEVEEMALDATLCLNCKDWSTEFGGYTCYVARGEDEELLTVNPVENSLSLVYRDKETLKFIKHINHKIQENCPTKYFHDIALVYHENLAARKISDQSDCSGSDSDSR